jgi:predicted transcriptional regulator
VTERTGGCDRDSKKTERGQNTIRGGSDPTVPQNRGPVPSGFGGHSRLLLLEDAAGVLAAQDREIGKFVRQDVRQTVKEDQGESMAIIKAPPKQPKTITIQARVEESTKTQLDNYAKFIDSTTSYVITEALKLLFKRDDEFKRWLGQHTNNRNQKQIQGDALTKTA